MATVTRFLFQSDRVSSQIVDQFAEGGNSSLTFTTNPTNDTVSEAFNNVRFRCQGISADGGFDTAFVKVAANALFQFRLPVRSLVTAHAHFLPLGTWSVAGLRKSWLFDAPGRASASLFGKITVIARRRNGTERFRRTSPLTLLQSISATGGDQSDFDSASVAPQLLQHTLSLSPTVEVRSTDLLVVLATQVVQGLTIAGGSFSLNFNAQGSGLNSPMAVINFEE